MTNIFELFEVICNLFIGFFIVITGVTILPRIVEVSGEGSLTPLFYSLSICFCLFYFFLYKFIKIIGKKEKK